MISALAWVRKGVAASKPKHQQLDDQQYQRLQQEAQHEINDAKRELREKSQLDQEILNDPALKDFDLENYDSSDSEEVNVFSNVKGLAYHKDDEEDPYITTKEDESDDDVDIFESDNILLVAKTEDDISNIEVCVFEGGSDNLFVHHDFMLPSFPLALEWLDFKSNASGNFVAVSTFEPRIEIWDLDALDSMYPEMVLGTTDRKLLRQNKTKPHKEFHTDAVMGLSWNRNVRNLLASSSADTTVKLWDLSQGQCVQSYEHHKDKVQAVQWHPQESSVMLTGGFDQKVAALDSRAPNAVSWWQMDADVEKVMWDIHHPSFFFVATESGSLRYYDIRQVSNYQGGSPIYTLVAHDEAVSAVDQHPTLSGLLVTGSADETVKVWDVRENKPSMVISRNLDVGSVFAAQFCPDEPMLMAVGGSNGESRIWDMSTNADVRKTFGDAQVRATVVKEKPLVGLQQGEDEDEDEEEDAEAVIAEIQQGTSGTVEESDSDQMASDSD